MASQESIIKFKGRIGDLTFFKGQDGYQVRKAGGVSGARIRTDPAYARTRENGAEFGRAGKAAKLIRQALRTHLLPLADKRMTSRLTKILLMVIQADGTHVRGERTVMGGDLTLLRGFEFNANGSFLQRMLVSFTTTFERATGSVTIALEAFVPRDNIVPPVGATHSQLVAAGALLDFDAERHTVVATESAAIPVDEALQPAQTLSLTLPASSTLPLVVALGIQFFQQVNGQLYPMKNGGHNGFAVVHVAQS